MSLRGVQKPGARTVTSALHGLVRDDPRTRQEFLALTGGHHEQQSTRSSSSAPAWPARKAAETLRERGLRRPHRPRRRRAATARTSARRCRKDYLRGESRASTAWRPRRGLVRRARRRAAHLDRGRSRSTPARARSSLGRRRAPRLRPAAARHRRASRARLPVPGARPRRRPLPAHGRRLRRARARGSTAAAGWSSIGARLDRRRGRRLRAPVGRRGDARSRRLGCRSSACSARELGALLPRRAHATTASSCVLGAGVEALRGRRAASSACALADGSAIDGDRRRRRRRRRAAHRAGRATPASRSATASSSTSACETSVAGVFAAGDVANADAPVSTAGACASSTGRTRSPGPGGGARRCSARTRRYDTVPYFFSDQYDVGMEYAGLRDPDWDERRLPRRHRAPASSSRSGCATAASSPA